MTGTHRIFLSEIRQLPLADPTVGGGGTAIDTRRIFLADPTVSGVRYGNWYAPDFFDGLDRQRGAVR